MSGSKASKNGLSVLVSIVVGDFKLKPIFTYRSEYVRFHKNNTKYTLPAFLKLEQQSLDDSTSLDQGLLNICRLLLKPTRVTFKTLLLLTDTSHHLQMLMEI